MVLLLTFPELLFSSPWCLSGIAINIFRAPVLVAMALIELGMKYEDAVELIRRFLFDLSFKVFVNNLYACHHHT